MKPNLTILLVIFTVLIIECYCQSSPCPDVFHYESDGQRNYGIITIPGPSQGRTIMQARIGIRGPIYNRGTGRLQLLKSLDASVEDARRGIDVQYILNFPQSQQLPVIFRLTLNNRDICNGPEMYNVPTWTFTHEFTYPSGMTQLSYIPERPNVFPPDIPFTRRITTTPPPNTPPPPPPSPPTTPPNIPPSPVFVPSGNTRPSDGTWLSSLPFAETCGRRVELDEKSLAPTQLIIGGMNVSEGEFPWLVALFHFNNRRPEYKCGASLISNTYVLTAAHCTHNQKRVYLELGKHNIADAEEPGYEARISRDIIANPEYVTGAHGDISLILIDQVEITPKIRPICLWAQGTNLDNLLRSGTIAGWGRVENDGDLSQIPMKLSVRTAGLDQCRGSHEKLRDIATDKTFCAGGKNTGPCHGDSGSGFYVRHNNVWYLRGVISTSLGTENICILSEYAVYVDLAYYLDWLKPYLS